MNIQNENDKYNNIKARNIAMQVVQHSHNKNRGLSYQAAVKENMAIKASIDYWIKKITQN